MTAKLPDGATSAGLPPKALATEGHAGTVLCRPAKKLVFGEHAVMADGNEHNLIRRKEKGAPVEIVRLSAGRHAADRRGIGSAQRPTRMPHGSCKFLVLAQAPAADGRLWRPRSFHALVQDKPGRKPLAEIKLMKGEPAPVERRAEDIKARHTKYSKLRSFRGGAGRGCGKPAIEVSQSAGGERALAG